MTRRLGEDVASEISIQVIRRSFPDDEGPALPCGTVLIGRRWLEAYKALFLLPPEANLTHIRGMRVVEVGWDEFLQVTE